MGTVKLFERHDIDFGYEEEFRRFQNESLEAISSETGDAFGTILRQKTIEHYSRKNEKMDEALEKHLKRRDSDE